MIVGVQFTGSLGPNQSRRWFTYNWAPQWHVIWYMIPVTPRVGAPEVEWEVAVERASPTAATYWLTVKNLTNSSITFEGRYAILN